MIANWQESFSHDLHFTSVNQNIQNFPIYITNSFPKFIEIQNLNLMGRQGNKEKYLPLFET